MWKIQLFKLNYDTAEEQAVAETVKSGWLTMGDKTTAFEAAFNDFLQDERTVSLAVSSCTAALHLALLATGIGPGDDVVIPALTFVAAANVVRISGARPRLADCGSMSNWNVSAESIEAALTPATKAIIIVHYAGYPCDMESISRLCRDRGLVLIEDVAHAPGASIGGRMCGTWGDVSCFSFFTNKNLSVGEGGMVVSPDPAIADRLRKLRSHGMSTLTLDRHQGRAITYDVSEPGLNYRIDEIRAALGLVQLAKLPAGNELRAMLTRRYRDRLAGSSVTMPFDQMPNDMRPVYHILPILLPEECVRENVIMDLRADGIQSSIHYPGLWDFTGYKYMMFASDNPLAAKICRRELTLPLYPTMTLDEVDSVCDALLQLVD